MINTDHNVVLNKWKEEYEKLYNPINVKPQGENSIKEEIDNELQVHHCSDNLNLMNSEITLSEVEFAVKQSKNKKAVGIDGIANELLKNNGVCRLLHSLFNLCFTHNIIPDSWREAIIHPIPKTKELSMEPMDYRGLALQSCIFKVFCSILNKRLITYLESENKLDEEQNGFRKNRNCQQHIFSLITVLKNECLLKKKSVFTAFIDFKKAFDV